MSTIIDELIVRLDLDSKDVESKAPAATKKLDDLDESAQGVEKSSKAAAVGLSEFAGKLGAFLALLGGTVALKSFIRDTIETNTQLHYFAANIGVAVGNLSSWGTVAAEFGGSAKDLQGTLSRLSMEATNFALRGQSSLIPFLSMMGLKFDQAHPENMLMGISGWVQKAQGLGLSRPAIHNILQQMGIDEGSINAMFQGTAALKAYLEQAKKLAPTTAEAAHAAQMWMQLVMVGKEFAKLGYDLLEKVYPILEKILGGLLDIGNWFLRHETIAEFIVGITIAVGGLTAAVGSLTIALGALKVASAVLGVGGLGSAAAEAAGGAAASAGGIAAFGSAIADFIPWVALAAAAGGLIAWIAEGFTGDNSGNVHRPAKKNGTVTAKNIPDVAQTIAQQEGFFSQGTIPRRANNPGDIEYGDFAKTHGATGSITAAGGKQIAVFPNEQAGWEAMYDLLGSSSYLGMSQSDAISKWQGRGGTKTSSLLMEHQNSIGAHLSAATPSKNITNHIGAINVYTQATDAKKMAADLGRGTDWLTFASQANSAVV